MLPLFAQGWQAPEGRSPALVPSLPPLQPCRVAERMVPKIEALMTQLDRAGHYRDVQPRFDQLSAAYAARALNELGARQAPFTIESLMVLGRVNVHHRRYLQRLVEIDPRTYRWCWPARPDLGERWPCRLVAAAEEDRLTLPA